MNTNLLTIVLSSGVLTAIISSIINFVSIRTTNKRFLQIENIKINNAINTFRYTKLFELNSDLNNLPDIDYTMLEKINGKMVQSENKQNKVVSECTNRFSSVTKIYNKANPLFDENLSKPLKSLFDTEKNESNSIVQSLYTGTHSDISKLLNIRIEVEEKLKQSITLQLRKLIGE
jgi:hypothetical protein